MTDYNIQCFHNPMKASELCNKQLMAIPNLAVRKYFERPLTLQESVCGIIRKKTEDYSKTAEPTVGVASLTLNVIDAGKYNQRNFYFTVFDAKFDEKSRPHYDESISQYQYATLFAGTHIMLPDVKIAMQGNGLAISQEVCALSEKIIKRIEPRKGDAWFTISLGGNPSELIIFAAPYPTQISRVGLYLTNAYAKEEADGVAIMGDLAVGITNHRTVYDITGGKTGMVKTFESFIQPAAPDGLQRERDEALGWISQSIQAAESFAGAVAEHFEKSIDDLDSLNFLRLKYTKYRPG